MNSREAKDRVITLAPGRVFSLRLSSAIRVDIHGGLLWLTLADGRDDHFMTAGESCRVQGPGLLVLEAANDWPVSFSIRTVPTQGAWRRLWRAAIGVWPVQRLYARWKALGSEKPSRYATSPRARC